MNHKSFLFISVLLIAIGNIPGRCLAQANYKRSDFDLSVSFQQQKSVYEFGASIGFEMFIENKGAPWRVGASFERDYGKVVRDDGLELETIHLDGGIYYIDPGIDSSYLHVSSRGVKYQGSRIYVVPPGKWKAYLESPWRLWDAAAIAKTNARFETDTVYFEIKKPSQKVVEMLDGFISIEQMLAQRKDIEQCKLVADSLYKFTFDNMGSNFDLKFLRRLIDTYLKYFSDQSKVSDIFERVIEINIEGKLWNSQLTFGYWIIALRDYEGYRFQDQFLQERRKKFLDAVKSMPEYQKSLKWPGKRRREQEPVLF